MLSKCGVTCPAPQAEPLRTSPGSPTAVESRPMSPATHSRTRGLPHVASVLPTSASDVPSIADLSTAVVSAPQPSRPGGPWHVAGMIPTCLDSLPSNSWELDKHGWQTLFLHSTPALTPSRYPGCSPLQHRLERPAHHLWCPQRTRPPQTGIGWHRQQPLKHHRSVKYLFPWVWTDLTYPRPA